MLSKTYQSNQLISILNSLIKDKATGVLNIKTDVSSWQKQRSFVLILREGELIYGNTKVPSNQELCRWLGEALKPNLIQAALSVAKEKLVNPDSIIELLELLIKMRVFTWQEIENLINTEVVLILEKIYRYPGEIQWDRNDKLDDFDLSYGQDRHGLDWGDICQKLKQRRQKWRSYAEKIPSMDAIPVVTPEQFKQIDSLQVKKHFKNSVNGSNTLVDIAESMGKDPLSIAKSYFTWANKDWVGFLAVPPEPSANQQAKVPTTDSSIQTEEKTALNVPASSQVSSSNLPTVLSVDDSPIVQLTIKRALSEHYNVLLANGATKALKILEQYTVDLMLLDLTMPDMDGLEFCRIVRQIPEFRELPIVMVTARDGLVNKMKGRIAGTSKYLTKPFSPDRLQETVHQLIAK